MFPTNDHQPFHLTDRFTRHSAYAWFAVAFLLSEYLGHIFAYGIESISILWPPTGTFAAALVLLHRRPWLPNIPIATLIDLFISITNLLPDIIANNALPIPNTLAIMFAGLLINPITPLIFATTFRLLIPNAKPLAGPKTFGL